MLLAAELLSRLIFALLLSLWHDLLLFILPWVRALKLGTVLVLLLLGLVVLLGVAVAAGTTVLAALLFTLLALAASLTTTRRRIFVVDVFEVQGTGG